MALTQKITPQKIYQKNDEIATHYKIQTIHPHKICVCNIALNYTDMHRHTNMIDKYIISKYSKHNTYTKFEHFI